MRRDDWRFYNRMSSTAQNRVRHFLTSSVRKVSVSFVTTIEIVFCVNVARPTKQRTPCFYPVSSVNTLRRKYETLPSQNGIEQQPSTGVVLQTRYTSCVRAHSSVEFRRSDIQNIQTVATGFLYIFPIYIYYNIRLYSSYNPTVRPRQ